MPLQMLGLEPDELAEGMQYYLAQLLELVPILPERDAVEPPAAEQLCRLIRDAQTR